MVTGPNGFIYKKIVDNNMLDFFNDVYFDLGAFTKVDKLNTIDCKIIHEEYIKKIITFKNLNCKIIFASSIAAEHPESCYDIYKRKIENFLISRGNYIILRIPNVYSTNIIDYDYMKNDRICKRILKGKLYNHEIENMLEKDEYIEVNDLLKEIKFIYNKKDYMHHFNYDEYTLFEFRKIIKGIK